MIYQIDNSFFLYFYKLYYYYKMENTSIQDKFRLYLDMQKDFTIFKKKQAEKKKMLNSLEDEIKEYMKSNNMDTISLKEGEIIMYDRKVSLTFKKESILEKLTEKLKGDDVLAEKLAESIMSNKIFNVESKIKANIKKDKKV